MMTKDRFFGVGEPLIQRQRDQGIDAAAYLDLVAGLGCTAYRSWMHITEILDDPAMPNPEAVAMHTKLPDRAAALATHSLGGDMPDFLPVMYSVTWTLDKLYSRIKAGKFCSTNTDDMVVFGGGLAGCEIAVHLGMPGKRCTSLRCGINFPPTPLCVTARCS